ncbi:KilA-N domain-containing protein [Fortiea contorta]|uniref:KilA-N domain-containing protein n=1 Tax=Fortiea contorta TaxID=1892405 RepID=UPI001375D257|nr:KilA-N domain-containing protein [Fortiea contorta]
MSNPNLEVDTPKMCVSNPNLEVDTPKMCVSNPNLEVDTPKMCVSNPNLEVDTPKMCVSSCVSNFRSFQWLLISTVWYLRLWTKKQPLFEPELFNFFKTMRNLYMSNIEWFGNLVQDAQRHDGYINATKWCKHFEYRLDRWKRLPETKAKLEHLKTTQSNAEPWIVERVGKTWVTWVHPIMAVHLADYLDPAFANYAAQIVVRYATDDPTLAADIASRQNTVEGLDVINEAVQKQYSLIFGRDWLCETERIKFDFLNETPRMRNKLSERNLVSVLNNKFGLPCQGLVVIHPLSEEMLQDFLKDKYPNIYQRFRQIVEIQSGQYLHIPLVDETALFSYFILEINDWVREKGGTADPFR